MRSSFAVQKESTVGQTYNLGYGETTKIIDLAKMILRILNLLDKTEITTTNVSWQGDVTTIWFDITKAKKELNWSPKITLGNTLREMAKARKLI